MRAVTDGINTNDKNVSMNESVIINKEFRGPPEYGQGGYVSGVVAQLIGDAAEVTLRRPAPLEKLLKVQRLDEGGVRLPHRLGPNCLY